MSNTPLVSVIMPVHNAGVYLHAAVDSILRQTYPAFELILVDDHCTDGAIEALPAEWRADGRLTVVPSPERGVVAAMRAGAARARGDLIARMDADDIALPERLAEQVRYLQANPDVGIAGARVAIFSDNELGGGFRYYQDWVNRLCAPADIERELFVESPIPNPTAMFRRPVYESLGGYHDTRWAEDYDLYLRAWAAGVRMGKPDAVLLRWRDHNDRLTRRDTRYSNDLFLQAKGHYMANTLLKERSAVIWGAGRCGARLHDILTGEGVRVTAFLDIHPRRIGNTKRGLEVLPAGAAAELSGPLIVAAVPVRGAREQIRSALLSWRKTEGGDFIFAA